MTISELIEELKKRPPSMPVKVSCSGQDYESTLSPVESVHDGFDYVELVLANPIY